MIRVESEETQDYVRESLAISQEGADEVGFVPSVLREPRGIYYWCDNCCSDRALRYMQIASMVIEESGEARTSNLCQRCCNEKLVQQGKQSLKSKEWREVVARKAHRGRVWKVFGSEQFLRGMWEYFLSQKGMGKEDVSGRRSREPRRNAKISGNMSLPSKRFWSKSKEVRIQIAVFV